MTFDTETKGMIHLLDMRSEHGCGCLGPHDQKGSFKFIQHSFPEKGSFKHQMFDPKIHQQCVLKNTQKLKTVCVTLV